MVDALIGGAQSPQERGVHYLLLEACVTFLGWESLFPVPPGRGAAPQLIDYLVQSLRHMIIFGFDFQHCAFVLSPIAAPIVGHSVLCRITPVLAQMIF